MLYYRSYLHFCSGSSLWLVIPDTTKVAKKSRLVLCVYVRKIHMIYAEVEQGAQGWKTRKAEDKNRNERKSQPESHKVKASRHFFSPLTSWPRKKKKVVLTQENTLNFPLLYIKYPHSLYLLSSPFKTSTTEAYPRNFIITILSAWNSQRSSKHSGLCLIKFVIPRFFL